MSRVTSPAHLLEDEPESASPGRWDIVQISSLKDGYSPRLAGEDEEHIQRLMELESETPPIVVHRQTMRVIDGIHRVRAAVLRGATTISAEFFDGSEGEAFIRAVELNIKHGLPLTTADRKAAAAQIIATDPALSDRMIAKSSGLTGKTVASIRRSTADNPQLNMRKGRDGRARPIDPQEGRRVAGELIAARPDATVREIAREAGISVGTAKDVRDRINRGESPLRRHRVDETTRPPDAEQNSSLRVVQEWNPRAPDSKIVLANLERLRRDPSVRLSEPGRELVRWLSANAAGLERWPDMFSALPPHCIDMVAQLARHYASEWQPVEQQLKTRSK